MSDTTVHTGPGGDGGTVVDLAQEVARATGAYTNVVLAEVNDHVVRMSVMREPFYWHRHPDSDETFLIIEGNVLVQIPDRAIELGEGQMWTVPAGVAHVTRPTTPRSVNLTIEKAGMTTERVTVPS